MTKFQILHISDLHMQKYESFDQSVVLDSLIERVKQDRKNGINPEIVVVTGDIACSGQKAEYLDAKAFFDDLLDSLDLDNDRIFIVPGNHDVNRKKYRPTDVPVYKTMRALNDELENKEFRKDLFKGMNDYFSFIKKNYVHLRTVDNRLVPFANIFDAACGKKIGLVGLNSAWMCRKSPDEREIAIGEYQIKKAMQALSKEGNLDLRINVFHHPLTWLWPEDRKTARSYFNNSILMCGHLHDAEGGYLSDLDGSLYQFQAGGAYLGSDSDWPSRFQYITFNWEENLILLDFLKFVRGKRKWSIDGETGDDGKKFFELVKPGKRAAKPEIESPLERPETYFKWITDNYGHMDADKLYGKGDAFPLSLPEIFIPLYTNEPGKNAGKDPGLEERQRPVDVEALIAKNDHLLIEGHAGSGKTTLLKHLTYCLARKSNDGFQIKGMDDFLPVLILLKDLNDFFTRSEEKLSSGTNAEDILIWYFRSIMGGVLSIETLNKFLKAQKAVFLLDGLDELLPRYRDTIANAFADLRVKNKGSKVVFTGRPHGIEGAAVKRFGDKHIAILALNMEQVKEFIRKWFAYLYPGSSGIGSKNAESMIGEVKTHPAIEELIDNPLMLTAICILYHDGKELPGQRAELYKKFVDNLLYRRFDDSEMVHDYLKTLAFKMHSEGIRAVDRAFAVGELKGVYKRKPEETEENYKKRTNDTFEDIEPKCGLLKFESGQFNFWHLTFQEFLTARHIMDNSTDFGKAISAYWDNDWYAEVIELYIGYLSIENKKWANQIIEQALETEDPPPFNRWRLSARTLLDIHRDRREETAQVLAKDRLLAIIDSVDTDPKYRADAGETLGWLGDTRNFKAFVKIEGDEYELEDIGKVAIKPFEIGKYPVTNSWFEEFMEVGGYENRDYWSPEGQKWLDETETKQPRYWDDRKWKCPNSPVVGVTWYEAYAFTRWLTIERKDGHEYSLLTEHQWQAAAAGLAGRGYPWGYEWDKNRCNNEEINLRKTSPVGIFKKGNTPEGVSDLSGNVFEWTDTWSDENEKYKVLRGGSWDFGADFCRCAVRFYDFPLDGFFDFGFRCART